MMLQTIYIKHSLIYGDGLTTNIIYLLILVIVQYNFQLIPARLLAYFVWPDFIIQENDILNIPQSTFEYKMKI